MLAAMASLVVAWGSAGCAKPQAPDVVAPGREVLISIVDPDAVDRWSVRTTSAEDVVVLRLSGHPVVMSTLKVEVLLPGRVVVARLAPPQADEFAIAVSGRAVEWTVEFRLGERGTAPAEVKMSVGQPRVAPDSARWACAQVLRSRGVDAWVVAIPGPPAGAGLTLPGLGVLSLDVSPPGAASAVSPGEGAPTVLHVRGGAVLRGDASGLGCEPDHLQLNLRDTGRGKPPVLTVFDAQGHRLCGEPGQPACLFNPSADRWVTWSPAASRPIRRLSLECDELFVSSIVIQ